MRRLRAAARRVRDALLGRPVVYARWTADGYQIMYGREGGDGQTIVVSSDDGPRMLRDMLDLVDDNVDRGSPRGYDLVVHGFGWSQRLVVPARDLPLVACAFARAHLRRVASAVRMADVDA